MSGCKRVWLAGLMALALASNVADAQHKSLAPTARSPQSKPEISLSGKTVTQTVPLRVRMEPTAALRAAFARVADGETAIRLSVQTVAPKPDEWMGLRIFLNPPKEHPLPATKSPYYVGSIAFYGYDEGAVVTFTFDLGPTIQRLKQVKLWRADKPLTVMLVGILDQTRHEQTTSGLVIKQITISVSATPSP